jgi:hypothetical protein
MKGLSMRTEDDLRVALAAREQLTPSAGPVLDGLGQAMSRRRYRLLTSSAAAATAVAGAVVTVLAISTLLTPAAQQPAAPPPASPPARTSPPRITDVHAADRPDFFFTIEPTIVAGYQIRPSGLSPTGQSAVVAPATGGDWVGAVSLERPGSMDDVPASAPSSQVHGEPAWFVADDDHGFGFLYWEYAPDSMAVVSLRYPDAPLSDFLAIAEGVTFVDPYPAHLPLRLGYLPEDLRPISLNLGQLNAQAVLSIGDDIGDVEPEAAHPREVTIQLLDHRPAPGELIWLADENTPWGPWGPTTTIGPHTVRCVEAPAGLNYDDARACEIEVPGGIVIVQIFELTATEIEQLIAGLIVADPTDPTTWFSSVEALP